MANGYYLDSTGLDNYVGGLRNLSQSLFSELQTFSHSVHILHHYSFQPVSEVIQYT